MQSIPQFTAYVGIDVSGRQLDIHTLPAGTSFSLPNTRSGIWDLISRLAELDEVLVVLEATGGLQRETAKLLAEAGFAVSVVNPRQIRDFARAIGLLAKTDTLDAAVIARFAQAVQPTARVELSVERAELAGLVARRRQLVAMVTAEGNRLRRAEDRILVRRLKAPPALAGEGDRRDR